MFSQASVILSTGGVYIRAGSASRGGLHSGGSASRGVGQNTPSPYRILRDTVQERAVRIQLECILVLMLLIYRLVIDFIIARLKLVYLHTIPAYPSPWNSACYVMITVDHGSTSTILFSLKCIILGKIWLQAKIGGSCTPEMTRYMTSYLVTWPITWSPQTGSSLLCSICAWVTQSMKR